MTHSQKETATNNTKAGNGGIGGGFDEDFEKDY
jgi:hypothetical protein